MIAVGYKYDIYILELFYKSRDNCLTILNRIEQRTNRTEPNRDRIEQNRTKSTLQNRNQHRTQLTSINYMHDNTLLVEQPCGCSTNKVLSCI